MTDTLERALDLACDALTIPGPAGQHAARARESVRLARASTDQAAKIAHLKDARQAVDAALDVLQEEASGQATPTAPDVRP